MEPKYTTFRGLPVLGFGPLPPGRHTFSQLQIGGMTLQPAEVNVVVDPDDPEATKIVSYGVPGSVRFDA